jgi:hypothetical protein
MRLVDDDGRVFGRVNLVDALVVLFVLGLIPLAYASMLIFRSPRPQVRSVERAEVNREDRRIANGLLIRQKLKVHGEHFTPVLRAFIGSTPAIGFTFEDPTSADVIVGDVPMGTHDLILYDGVQEVARVPNAVTRQPAQGAHLRIVGALVQLDRATADGLSEGQRFTVSGEAVAELLKLGPVASDRQPIAVKGGSVDTPIAGSWSRSVLMRVACDQDPDRPLCRVGTTTLGDPAVTTMEVPGAPKPMRVLIGEIVPDDAPHLATARVRVEGDRAMADRIRTGDRDMRGEPVDDRTASVAAVSPRGDGVELVVRFGLDRSRDGWQYKAQPMNPGSPFTFITDRYAVSGRVLSLAIDER